MAAITHKSLADGQLANSKGTIYTAAEAVRVTFMSVVPTSSTRTINIYVKRSGSSSRRIVRKDYSVAAGTELIVIGPTGLIDHLPLSSGDLIEGDASAATEVDFTICGGAEV